MVDPSGLAIWPGGGDSHPDDPDSDWNCPGGHGVGPVAPSRSTKNPGSEGVQTPDLAQMSRFRSGIGSAM